MIDLHVSLLVFPTTKSLRDYGTTRLVSTKRILDQGIHWPKLEWEALWSSGPSMGRSYPIYGNSTDLSCGRTHTSGYFPSFPLRSSRYAKYIFKTLYSGMMSLKEM